MSKLDLQNKRVAILGLGVEGIALAKFLKDKTSKITFLDKLSKQELIERAEADKETVALLLSEHELVSGDQYLDNLSDFDIIFRSPGISINDPRLQDAVKNGVKISSQIKLFFDLCPCKIIGVTGTKGKGTTSSLIFEILKKKYQISNIKSNVYLAGNIGYPAITLIPELKESDIVILELSSFQLMDLERSPHIAVVTNLSVDHLDYHKDVAEYQEAKTSIIKFQNEDDFAILNSNSSFDQKIIDEAKSQKKYFSESKESDAEVIGDEVILDPQNRNIKICDFSSIKLFGQHNLENIAAATLAADVIGVDQNVIKETVKEFEGLPHRIEFVAEINGIKFINDSFATNPDPTMAAINSFKEDKILILGGSSKGADFSKLAQKILSSNVKSVILIGAEADKIKKSLFEANFSGNIVDGENNIDAIAQQALGEAKNGEVVIFSPACASFDMFKNYKVRGEMFKSAVLKLKK